jgi:hypothetical protein
MDQHYRPTGTVILVVEIDVTRIFLTAGIAPRIAPKLGHVATTGLTLTLSLIGAGLSAQTLRRFFGQWCGKKRGA